MAIEAARFRQIAGTFATGVAVVATGKDGQYHAITVNSFTTVSLEPTLLLVCLDNRSHALPVVIESGVMNVNVLREDQEHISRIFASRDEDHSLQQVTHEIGRLGAPILPGCLAYFECRVVDTLPGGDHTIVLGEVEDAQLGEIGMPLLFFRGRYGVRVG